MKRVLTLLDDIRIASPCHESWENMAGDDRVRHCGECKKSVYNLSSMSAVEANQLLEATEAKICVRLYKRADGMVITSDCTVRRDRMFRRIAKRVVLAVASWLGLALSTGCRDRESCEHTMGVIRPTSKATMGEPMPIPSTATTKR